jgi:hypothetical protein
MAGFVCLDIGFDSSMSLSRAWALAFVPPAQHASVLNVGVPVTRPRKLSETVRAFLTGAVMIVITVSGLVAMIIAGRSLSRKRHQLDDVNTSATVSSSSSSSSSSETGSNNKKSSQNKLDKEQRCVSDEEKNRYCSSSDSSLQSETRTSFTERDQLIGPKKTKLKMKREKNGYPKRRN